MKHIFEILEDRGITVNEYVEDGVLCGYELDTYTSGGVNIIIFLDYREKGDPLNAEHFISKFHCYMDDFDIDEEIDIHRQDQNYKNHFTISQSLKDFKLWKKELNKTFIKNIKA